ncbi:TonB-dependent receptor [Phragmitibacter flavus]|uniref:TonB-dependent receptor n=1 Tax=Phragmitibacter flavus TaxID=2576071 RepID=A0A5R8KC70_9BACT|nr:TonB-dependent receptor [Phragmitibacter flavus]TLD69179.1 TonB-dependent receptor [Phragmitibacter flavus]
MKHRLLLSAILIGLTPLSAQQSSLPATTTLPEVTVNATQDNPSLTVPSSSAARTELARTPGNTSVVDAETYRLGRSSSFEDIFSSIPGVYSPARGSDGDEVKLSIRGSGLDLGFHLRGIKLLQDGVPVTLADGFGDFQSIDPLSLDYVEVFRGSNALRYGSTTLGGAINFVSPTGYSADPFRIRLEGGSYGYLNGQISSGGVSGPFDYYISTSFLNRDGFQEHSELRNRRFFGNFGYRISDDIETRFFLTYVESRSALPGNLTADQIRTNPRAASADAIAFDQRRDVDWFRIANKTTFQIDSEQRLETSLYYTYFLLDHPLFWNPFFLNGLGVRYGTYNSFGGELRYLNEADLFGRKNRLTMGFAPAATFLHDERLINDFGKRGARVGDGDTTAINYDFYIEDQHYLTDQFSLILGSSFTYAVRNFDDNFLTDPNGDQSRDQSYTGFSPKLGALYELSQRTQLFANVSRSFEPPTTVEIVGLGGPAGDVLTREISEQTATTIEVGTRGESGRFKWEIAYYYSWLKNELLTLNDSAGNPLGTINGPDTHHQGIEFGLDTVLWQSSPPAMAIATSAKSAKAVMPVQAHEASQLTLKQIFNWNDFRFDNSESYGDNQLAGAPEFFYRAELLLELSNGIYMGPNFQWVSKLPADYANSLYADGYAILGFRLGYRSPKGWTIFAEARNLTDENYASSAEPIADARTSFGPAQVFHPGEPLSFFAGFEYKF